MTTTLRRGLAATFLSALALSLVGCGGGGGGIATPTRTPNPNATPTRTPVPTSTPVPGSGGTPITANQLVFVSNRNSNGGNADLYKSQTDGSSVVRLTSLSTLSGGVEKPSVSPGGTSIVFQFGDSSGSGASGNIEIASINVDGSNFRRLTNDGTGTNLPDDFNPVFSSDGQFIYWTSTRSGVDTSGQTTSNISHIWRMDATGTNQIQIVKEPSAYPSLDRNGNLAYIATTNTTQPVAIFNLTSQTVTKRIGEGLSSNQGAFGLALSPDGNRVAYSLGMAGSGSTASSVQIRVFSVTNGQRDGGSPMPGSSNRVSNWSRDSTTLFFDSANGANSRRQVFSSVSPFSTQTPITTDAGSDNSSPAFLPGSG